MQERQEMQSSPGGKGWTGRADIFHESHRRQPESDNSMTNSELLGKQPRGRLPVDERHP